MSTSRKSTRPSLNRQEGKSMKHPRFVMRTVRRDGTIKWDHRIWRPHPAFKNMLEPLIGKRFAYKTYGPEYKSLSLWGTEAEYRAVSDKELESAEEESRGMLTTEKRPEGLAFVFEDGNNLPSGKTRYYITTWWHPVGN